MNPAEKQLLHEYLASLQKSDLQAKDPEAAASIANAFPNPSDALYLLIQRGLIQTHALAAAQNRIAELEAALPKTPPAPQPPPPSDPPSPKTGFASKLSWVGKTPKSEPAPPAPSSFPLPTAPTESAFGSFLTSSATMAVGIAGGSLLYDLLHGMLSSAAAPNHLNTPTETDEEEASAPAHSHLGFTRKLSQIIRHTTSRASTAPDADLEEDDTEETVESVEEEELIESIEIDEEDTLTDEEMVAEETVEEDLDDLDT
ncbi:MAG: hypothetical protein RLZZ244_1823 [Verrucomicrobiota bacterium]|jgi:hypothetical protein